MTTKKSKIKSTKAKRFVAEFDYSLAPKKEKEKKPSKADKTIEYNFQHSSILDSELEIQRKQTDIDILKANSDGNLIIAKEKQHMMDMLEIRETANANLINAKAGVEKQRGKLIKKAVAIFETLPPHLQVYLVALLANQTSPNSELEIELDERVRESKAKKSESEASSEASKAEFEKWKNDKKMGKI